jgi:hypothetical protein
MQAIGPSRTRSQNMSAPARLSQKGQLPDVQNSAWISLDKPAKALVQTVKNIAQDQGMRLYDNNMFMSIYANRDFMSGYHQSLSSNAVPEFTPRMSDNQIRLHTDTLAGKLIQGNSRINMMTSMGDWDIWNRARKIEQALEGEWARMRLYREAQKVAVDGLVTGTGWLKLHVSDDGSMIDCCRVFPNEVFVDHMEAAFGPPRKLYQMRYVAKDTLAALYPDKMDIIATAAAANTPRYSWTLYQSGMVEVVEAWALPVGDRPGRHCIALANGCLVDEDWDQPFFPLIAFKPCDSPFGWYGQGYAEQCMGAQLDLNKTLMVMQMSAHLGIAPYWLIQEGANISAKHLDNIPGHIIESSGADPKWMTNAPFHQAAPIYCQMLRQMIGDYYGANSLETGGQLPVNRLDSKKALRAYEDISATRITTLVERWSTDFFVDVCERTIMLAGQIAKAKGGYPVLVNKDFKKAIQLDWKDLDIKRNAYLIRPAPANFLSSQPSGKLQDIQDLMGAGLINQMQGQRLMQGPPDIAAALAESTAPEDDLDALIEEIVEKGEYRPPITLQDLPRGIKRLSDARMQYRTLGLADKRLALFDRWIAAATNLLKTMAPPPPTPGAGMTPPPALGSAPPNGIPAQPAPQVSAPTPIGP